MLCDAIREALAGLSGGLTLGDLGAIFPASRTELREALASLVEVGAVEEHWDGDEDEFTYVSAEDEVPQPEA